MFGKNISNLNYDIENSLLIKKVILAIFSLIPTLLLI